MKHLIITLLGFCLAGQVLAQSKSIARFKEQHPTEQTLFFYPSTLRMVNLEKDATYNEMVRNVDKLQFLSFAKGDSALDQQSVKQLQQDILKEAYEVLFSMDQPGKSIRIYAAGQSPEPEGLVGMIDSPETLMLLDMKGFIDMAALLRLMQSDFDFKNITRIMNTTAEHQNKRREEKIQQK